MISVFKPCIRTVVALGRAKDSLHSEDTLADKVAPKADMKSPMFQLRKYRSDACLALPALLLLSASIAPAQQTASAPTGQSITELKVAPAAASPVDAGGDELTGGSGITEEELTAMLVGKPLFLRSGNLSDSLNFNLHGHLIGESVPAPFTLCAVEINSVRLSRRKVELRGKRYGLHFLGALAYEDSSKAVDRVNITPKKKFLKLTIERELVVKPKKKKAPKANNKHSEHAEAIEPGLDESWATAQENEPAESRNARTTTSPAHSAMVLREALDNVFASSVDTRMIANMPDYWRLYYQAAEVKVDYRPANPAVMRQDSVDKKAKLISKFEPESNQYAQDHGVAGMSLYDVVIDADGKPGEIAVARPIGFGLDENAVAAIRKARFEPAIKDGKPVPVLLDLVVQFRIYSKRTAVRQPGTATDNPTEPVLPGPYSANGP